MSPNNKIFCNTPWYELHIYWDGSFGICCQEDHKLHSDDQRYNIATMSIMEWFNSEPVRQFRLNILEDQKISPCRRCYYDEEQNHDSRRMKSNQKSVIFTKTAFEPSFTQSPGHTHFEHSANNNGETNTQPIDLHVDLGNFCNLACKMCNSKASSVIASQEVKWGIQESRKYLGTDWTRDNVVWESFKQQLLDIPNLNNIHFMGGETLLTSRFEDFLDTMIEHQRFDLCFSFVTNGTVFKPSIVNKLKQFKRVGIEVSIETLDARNSYVRQGTDTATVLQNIKKYQLHCNGDSITLTLRPTLSAMTIGGYLDLLKFALDNKFLIKSLICFAPQFFSVVILPQPIKEMYLGEFKEFINTFTDIGLTDDYNASDPNNYLKVIKGQVAMCISLLETPAPEDSKQQLRELVKHCQKWDKVYNLNAREVYPELEEIWNQYGY